MDPERKKVFYYAAGSRVVFLLLSALSDMILPNYSSDAFKTTSLDYIDLQSEDQSIWKLFGGLLQWDAHHYLQIAEYGYIFENNIAFFPLFPILIKILGQIFWLSGVSSHIISSHLIAALLINNLLFVKAALILYDLTLFIFNDTKFAYKAAIFFCISPATVFFIAPYTETLFSYCTFKGMLAFSRKKTHTSLFWFFLSCCLRSNGVTFAGFILHAWAYCCLSQLPFSTFQRKVKICARFAIFSIHYVLVIFIPYILFQIYCYLLFCHVKRSTDDQTIKDQAEQYQLILSSDYISWCYNGFVFPYFIVQEKHWNVGFLRYYQFKQIPNFVLAFPVCFLVFYSGFNYLKKYWFLLFNPKSIYSYGLFPVDLRKKYPDYPPTVFLFFMHVLFLNLWGVLNINVQVLTRLLASSSPVLYWIAAQSFQNLPKKSSRSESFWDCLLPFEKDVKLGPEAVFVKSYFIGYAVMGIILFCNGFPWT